MSGGAAFRPSGGRMARVPDGLQVQHCAMADFVVAGRPGTGLRRAWQGLRRLWTEQVEIQERLLLVNRPWEEEFLHWSDGVLHGSVAPPADRRRRSVTSSGWCPALQLAARRTGPAT
jgi:hypothetical protein